MSSSTVLLVGIIISIFSFLGGMLFTMIKVGEYKREVENTSKNVDDLKKAWAGVSAQVADLTLAVGNVQGQLERMNGRVH